jgi:integrase
VLRQVFTYAVERQLIASNPAIGVKPHKEAKRGRLLTMPEFHAIRAQAGPRLRLVIDLLAMTGQRVSDILALRRDALREDGVYVRQGKTGAQVLIRWTPELRATVERAKTLHGNVRAFTLLHGRTGKPVDYRTLRDQWALACQRAGVEDAHLHDLRAMSATMAQAQGLDAQGLLGHTSPAMTKRYLRDRSPTVVDGPSIGQVLDVGRKRAENQ